jgi:hypothetical protein
MENKLKLEIVTPYGLAFSEEVDEVVASGSDPLFYNPRDRHINL